ncbi:MAG: hypothetical protein EOP04_09110 [Proteobacteria bacterium]|nr:MAG: hypothetical protein EOP04_09110 [Pseudomonadota bacterium]
MSESAQSEANICIVEEGDYMLGGVMDLKDCSLKVGGCAFAIIEGRNADSSSVHTLGVIQMLTNKIVGVAVLGAGKPNSQNPGNSREPKPSPAQTPETPKEPEPETPQPETPDVDSPDAPESTSVDNSGDAPTEDGPKDPDDGGAPEAPSIGADPESGGENPDNWECSSRTNCMPPEELIVLTPLNPENLPCAVASCSQGTVAADSSLVFVVPLKPNGRIDCLDPRVTCISDSKTLESKGLKDKHNKTCAKKVDLKKPEKNAIACLLTGKCGASGKETSCPSGYIAGVCKESFCRANSEDSRCSAFSCKANDKSEICSLPVNGCSQSSNPLSCLDACKVSQASSSCIKAKTNYCIASLATPGCDAVTGGKISNTPLLPQLNGNAMISFCKKNPNYSSCVGVQPGFTNPFETALTAKEIALVCMKNPFAEVCK